MSDIVGTIPEFTTDESVETGIEEVKQPATEEVVVEKETPELPAETDEVEKPAQQGEDTEQPETLQKEVARATQGLRNEIVDLRNKLAVATGNDRKIIQQDIITAQQKVDDLADVNPADVGLIEKVLKAKGYVSKEELHQVTFEQAKKQTLDAFLNEFPEYKPENDPNDLNWKNLQKELTFYRIPEDPTKIKEILLRAHKAISPVVSDLNIPAKKRAAQVASAGSGGVQRSSSSKTLSPDQRRHYEDGGWSEEEIKAIEKSL